MKKALVLGLMVSLLFLSFNANAEKRSRAEDKEIASKILWEKDMPGAIVLGEFTPGGRLHIVARDGKSKKSAKTRYLYDYSGNLIWQGAEGASALFGDTPYITLMEVTDAGAVINAITETGAKKWSYSLKGVPASTISDPSGNDLIMVVMPYEWAAKPDQAYPATMAALDLNTGKAKWSSSIGEIKGGLESFGGELAIDSGSVWWAAGGRAVRASLANGNILSNNNIETVDGSDPIWLFSAGNTLVGRGGVITNFSNSGGVLWSKKVPKMEGVSGLTKTGSGILAYMYGKSGAWLALLNEADGSVIWEQKVKHNTKKLGPPPAGVPVFGGTGAVAAHKKLLGFDIETGKQKYEIKMKEKDFVTVYELQSKGSDFVANGKTVVAMYNIDSGSEVWKLDNFFDPIAETEKMQSAAMGLGMQGYAQIMGAPSNAKVWREYRSGSIDYSNAAIQSAFNQGAYETQMRGQGEALGKTLSKWQQIDLQLINKRLGPNYTEKYIPKGGSFMLLTMADRIDGALVDLNSGSVWSAGTKKARSGCIGQIMIDPQSRKMIQIYRQMGLGCSDEMKMEMYDFPK